MNLKTVGEFGFIESISQLARRDYPADLLGIGDDAALLPQSTKQFVVSTDMLIEGTHFLIDKISAFDLGRKTVAVNVSDIAAMGGSPRYAFLSISLPASTDIAWATRLMAGILAECRSYGVCLAGGDTTSGKLVALNLTIIGEINPLQAKLRSAAEIGDLVCVTGTLGDSGAGLKAILDNLPINSDIQTLIAAHCTPRAHVPEGQWLAAYPGVHAMMDISDGIASDLKHITKASQVGAVIDIEHLPFSNELVRAALQFNFNTEELGLAAGEDYVLLLTISPTTYREIKDDFERYFARPLSVIGKIVPGDGLTFQKNGTLFNVTCKGFDHFS